MSHFSFFNDLPLIKTSIGNIGNRNLKPQDVGTELITPELKLPTYTTGRGGSGNMAKNDQGAEARMVQDVGPVSRKNSITTPVSTGRGGGGNMAKPNTIEVEQRVDIEARVGNEHKFSGDVIGKYTNECKSALMNTKTQPRKGSLEKTAEKGREMFRRLSGRSNSSFEGSSEEGPQR